MIQRVMNGDYMTDPSFFACTMTLCALASARAADGALFPGRWNSQMLRMPPANFFLGAAKSVMARELCSLKGLNWLRTCGLIALYGVQINNVTIINGYLGMYYSLVSIDNLHHEENWPKDMGILDRELMRRLPPLSGEVSFDSKNHSVPYHFHAKRTKMNYPTRTLPQFLPCSITPTRHTGSMAGTSRPVSISF